MIYLITGAGALLFATLMWCVVRQLHREAVLRDAENNVYVVAARYYARNRNRNTEVPTED